MKKCGEASLLQQPQNRVLAWTDTSGSVLVQRTWHKMRLNKTSYLSFPAPIPVWKSFFIMCLFSFFQANRFIQFNPNLDELMYFLLLHMKLHRRVNICLCLSVLESGLVNTREGLPEWVHSCADKISYHSHSFLSGRSAFLLWSQIWYKLYWQRHIFASGSCKMTKSFTDIYF